LFNAWQRTLEKYGYKNFAKVLNAKDYGVPQNRERIFCISILNGDNYFFPQPKKLQIKLKDILEAKSDEKYYIKNTAADEVARTIMSHYGKLSYKQLEDPKHEKSTYLILNPDKEGNAVTIKAQYQGVAYSNIIKHSTDGYAATGVAEPIIVASRGLDHGSPQCLTLRRTEYGKQIRKEYEAGQIKEQRKNIQQLEPRTDGVSNTLTSVQKDNLVIVSYKGQELQDGDGFYSQNSKAFNRGGLPGLSRTLKAGTHDASVVEGYRIRKLTPRECFRLMGVNEKDIDTIQAAGISPSQQYKLAGNSIVVDVLAAIFYKLFINTENESQQLTLF
jgi:DNA (cytosine-5)-methyltransferase 1